MDHDKKLTCKFSPGVDLQKKWRNIRDSFVKAHKAKETNTGSAAKKKVLYVFYDKLLFLKDIAFNIKKRDVQRVKYEIANEVDDATTQVEEHASRTQAEDTPSENSWTSKRYKRNDYVNIVGKELIEVLKKNLERNNVEDDEDRLFFLSLVKEFKKIPERMRIQTKLDILKVIKDAQFSDTPNTCPSNYIGYQTAHYSGNMPWTQSAHTSEGGLIHQESQGDPLQKQSPVSIHSENSLDSE